MRTKLRKNRGFKNKKSGNQKIYLLGETRRSRDRQGGLARRRLGLVYTGGGVLRAVREMPRDIEMH